MTWLHSHLLLKGYHRTLAQSFLLSFRFALAWFHADVFLHFLLPLDLVVLIILRQFAEANNRGFVVNLLVMGPVIARAQLVGRVEQEIVLLIKLGDLTRNAHRAELHRVHVLFVALFGREWLRWLPSRRHGGLGGTLAHDATCTLDKD